MQAPLVGGGVVGGVVGPAALREARRGMALAAGENEYTKYGFRDLIASGGGVHNPQIMGHLAGFLPGVNIATSSDYGIDADAKEAISFAVLAHETWKRRPSNLPSATGARRAVVLGNITPGG